MLPEDDDVDLPTIDNIEEMPPENIPSEEINIPSEEINNQDKNNTVPIESSSVFPGMYDKNSENFKISKEISDRSHRMSWPKTGNTPLNEFISEGYMTRAFPTLFPTGDADFLGCRLRKITIGEYFKHLTKYEDGRFARHPRFKYFAFNTEIRFRALITGRIFVKKNPDIVSLQDLKDMSKKDQEIFCNKVTHFATNLRGTDQYWAQQRRKLIAMINSLGLPTIFFTHSAADMHWPELGELFKKMDPSVKSMSSYLIDNPAIASWYFDFRINQYISHHYINVLGAVDGSEKNINIEAANMFTELPGLKILQKWMV